MNCPYCSFSLPEGAEFCPSCGKLLDQYPHKDIASLADNDRQVICARCEHIHEHPAPKFCKACGFPLGMQLPEPKKEETPKPQESLRTEIEGDADTDSAFVPFPAVPEPTENGTPELEGAISPPESRTTIPQPPTRHRSWFRRLIIVIGAILILAAIIWVGKWIYDEFFNNGPLPSEYEACEVIEPNEDFEEANRNDLEGDLRRDSYFADGEEYSIAGDTEFRVPKGVTLIIEPGARVKFGAGSKMVVEGTLLACGKSGKPIFFSADTATGSPGYWKGIEFRDADEESVIGHATFEFSGGDQHAILWLENTDLHVEDVKFDGNSWYPISMDPNSYPKIRPPLEVENGPEGLEVREGTLSENREWTDDYPYVVRGEFIVGEKNSLSIQANTMIRFLPDSGMRVNGELIADGSSGGEIIFTSIHDGADEGSEEPKAGNWVGIGFFGRESVSKLSNVEVRYAGGGDQISSCLFIENSATELREVAVIDCAKFAISTDIASEPTLENFLIDTEDPLGRWELRESKLEGVTIRKLEKLETDDGKALYPIVTGILSIESDATLEVESGMVVLFRSINGRDTGIYNKGKLEFSGESRAPIILTSWRDSEFNPQETAAPGDWSGFGIEDVPAGNVQIGNLEVRYAGLEQPGCLILENSSPDISGVTVRQCSSYPITSDAASQPKIENININDNELSNLWEIRESKLEDSALWTWSPIYSIDNEQIIRRVTGVVTIEIEASLKLDPSLILKFNDGKGIIVKGTLLAEGSEEDPVLLTSWRDPVGYGSDTNPQPGDWGGIVLDGSEKTILNYTQIKYAGISKNSVGCLNIKSSSPNINNLTVESCAYYPITSDLTSDPTADNLQFLDNQPANEWAIRESSLSKGNNRTWSVITQANGNETIIRTITGQITIEEGASLTIKEGVVAKVNSGVSILTRGALHTEGLERTPVILTSWRDPEYSQEGGVVAGDWIGIQFENITSDSDLEHLEVRYAGGDHKYKGAISMINSSPNLNNVLIRDSAWYPISMDVGSNPMFESIDVINNQPANAVEVRGGKLEKSGEQIWHPWTDIDGDPLLRVITGILTIAENATLRIEPDTVIKFNNSGGLDIWGGLLTRDSVLTSLHDDQYGGDSDGSTGGESTWNGIQLHGKRNIQLEDTLIRFAQIGVWMEDAAPTFTDVSIEDNWVSALSADLLSTPTVNGLQLVNNALNGMLIRDVSLPEGIIQWNLIGSSNNQLVRILQNPLTIGPSSQLIIGPGVVIKFGAESGIINEGRLQAGESGSDVVIFTSLSDDYSAGDTDNRSQQASRGSWTGIQVNPNDTTVYLELFSVKIQYSAIGLDLFNPFSFEVERLLISDSLISGIQCSPSIAIQVDELDIEFADNARDISGCPIVSNP